MKSKIKDVWNLYIGQDIIVVNNTDENKELGLEKGMIGKLVLVNDGSISIQANDDLEDWDLGFEFNNCWIADWKTTKDFKLVLRPISDMTAEESKIYHSLNKLYPASPVHSHLMVEHATFETFAWLLKQGFDLFGLIEFGQAIDKTTYKI